MLDWRHVFCCPLCGDIRVAVIDKLDIARCASCGLLYSLHVPSHERLLAHAVDYTPIPRPWLEKRARERMERIERCSSHHNTLLDVGTGIGTLVDVARKSGWRAGGCDINPPLHDHIRKCDASHIVCYSDVDVVVISHLLEHLESPGTTLCDAHSTLNKSGLLYVEVPNEGPWSLRRRIPQALGWVLPKYREFRHHGLRKLRPEHTEWHLTHWSMPTLLYGLKQAGFTVVSQGYGRVHLWRDSIWAIGRKD